MWISLLLVSVCVLQALSGDSKGTVADVKVPGTEASSSDQSSCSANPQLDSCSGSSVRPPRSVLYSVHDDGGYYRHVRDIKQKSYSKGFKQLKPRVARSADNQELEGTVDDILPQQNYQAQILPRHGGPAAVPVLPGGIIQVQEKLRLTNAPIPTTQFLSHVMYCPHCRQRLPPTPAVFQQPMDPRVFQQFQNPRMFTVGQLSRQQSPFGINQAGHNSNSEQNFAPSFFPEEMCPYDNGEDQSAVEGFTPDVTSNTNFLNQTSQKIQKSNSNIIKSNFNKALMGKYAAGVDHKGSEAPTVPTSSKPNILSSANWKSKLPTIEELAKFIEAKKSN